MDNIRVQWSNAVGYDVDYAAQRPPKAQVERVYRTPAVSDRHFAGEDRMEASLHYLRGRTDALLSQLQLGGGSRRPPPSFQLNADAFASASARTRPPPVPQYDIEASLHCLQANKQSLSQLYHELHNLRSTFQELREHDPAAPAAQPARYYPPPSIRFADELPSHSAHVRPILAVPNDVVLALPAHAYSASRPLQMARTQLSNLIAAPPKPSTYMRYLRNLRQNVMDKVSVDELAASLLRNRAGDCPASKYDAKSDYQPLLRRPPNCDTFRPIAMD